MPVIVNPFETGGYTLAHMSRAIQIIPNLYGRLNQLKLFGTDRITQRNVTVESAEGELRLLPTRPVGAPATMCARCAPSPFPMCHTMMWCCRKRCRAFAASA